MKPRTKVSMWYGKAPIIRFTRSGTVAARSKDEQGPAEIIGYAAVFYDEDDPGTEYDMGWGYRERIMPGAFTRAIGRDGDDVRALFNHEPDNILGRNRSGTLVLTQDKVGLGYRIDPPDNELAKRVIDAIERGDITGSSFAFVPIKTTFREVKDDNGETDYVIVEREEVQLWDVGPVTYPAFESTTAQTKSALPGAILTREKDPTWAEVQEFLNSRADAELQIALAERTRVEVETRVRELDMRRLMS